MTPKLMSFYRDELVWLPFGSFWIIINIKLGFKEECLKYVIYSWEIKRKKNEKKQQDR